jgi:hypothetical protein
VPRGALHLRVHRLDRVQLQVVCQHEASHPCATATTTTSHSARWARPSSCCRGRRSCGACGYRVYFAQPRARQSAPSGGVKLITRFGDPLLSAVGTSGSVPMTASALVVGLKDRPGHTARDRDCPRHRIEGTLTAGTGTDNQTGVEDKTETAVTKGIGPIALSAYTVPRLSFIKCSSQPTTSRRRCPTRSISRPSVPDPALRALVEALMATGRLSPRSRCGGRG